MTDIAWAVPAALALCGTLLLAAIVVLVVRVRHRSARAQAVAAQAVTAAEETLGLLDDAVEELDLAFEAAGAVPSDDAPADLRRAHAGARRARDRGFADVSSLHRADVVPSQRRADADRLRGALDGHLERVRLTASQLDSWIADHRTPEQLIAAARQRRDETVNASGDPAPLIATLRERFDAEDWHRAACSAQAGHDALVEAAREIDLATRAIDSTAVVSHVRRATDATRRAGRCLRAVEDEHRIALQAADNVAGELTAVRAEIEAALVVATSRAAGCAPDAGDRLRSASNDLDHAASRALRRPRAAIETVAHVREVRDDALGDAPSTRVRLEFSRAALPGTLACARAALAAADARADALSISARLRLETARRELASARTATDPVLALANARAAWHAVPPSEE